MEEGFPRVLVIAGYDQSAGAGLLADIKTLQAHGVYGYGVCTGLTFQHERTITRIHWFSEEDIAEQIGLCFASYPFEIVKIGITRSVEMLHEILRLLHEHRPGIRIVLDPVIRSSGGMDFWKRVAKEDGSGGSGEKEGVRREAEEGLRAGKSGVQERGEGVWKQEDSEQRREEFEELLKKVFLLTPNWEEIGYLYPGEDVMEVCLRLSGYCHCYLKGGHHPYHPGRDYLFHRGGMEVLEAGSGEVYPKHGSGCVLASSLAGHLALGYPLNTAAVRSKLYIEQFLASNQTLLGWHQALKKGSDVSIS